MPTHFNRKFYQQIIINFCVLFITTQQCCLLLTVAATNSEHYVRAASQQEPRYPGPYRISYDSEEYQRSPSNQGNWQQPSPPNQGNRYRSNAAASSSPTNPYQYNPSQQQQNNWKNRPNASFVDRNRRKCQYWVPIEATEKYPFANKIQMDQANQQHLIEICCPGFYPMRWRGSTYCRPLCENCQNGLCVAPGECKCYDEFVPNDNGDCVFTCPLGCLNGRCYLDGSCQCNPGYKLDETRKFCRPICSDECNQMSHLNCTEPEVCSCAKGYQLRGNGCKAVCSPDCGFGGYCNELHQCVCREGYTEKEGICQSDCYQKCDNGICYARNRCICNAGYTYHERSTQCIPI